MLSNESEALFIVCVPATNREALSTESLTEAPEVQLKQAQTNACSVRPCL